MPVIVAASVAGCRAWHGRFDGLPTSDGDLSHISDQLGQGEVLSANVGYLLSPDCVHESMVFDRTTQRTFLRIALPVEFNFYQAALEGEEESQPILPGDPKYFLEGRHVLK